jgi:tetratricopeptide (TPR) repeat protein
MKRVRRLVYLEVAAGIAALAVTATGAAWRGLKPVMPDDVWRKAELDLRAGRWASARAGLDRLARLRRPTPEDWMLRAQLASALALHDQSLDALAHIGDTHSLAAQARLMAGRIERQRHRLRYAEAAFRRAIELQPRMVEAHKELIYLFGMQLRRHEIDAEFKALGRLTPLSHHDLFTWGLTHFADWGPDVAGDLESFIAADPIDRQSRLALAELLLDAPDAESQVERALEPLPPSDLEATALLIELRLNHGRIDLAMAMLESVKASHPSIARIRGRVALLRGDRGAAIAAFKGALSNEPYDRVSLSELGKALTLQGDISAAREYLARAKRLDDVYNLINRVSRSDQENQRHDLTRLGRACEAAGLSEEARGWYMLAISRQPLDTEAQQALRRLRGATTP